MKAKDLRERSTEDLETLQQNLTKDLFSYRMKNHTGQLEDTSLLGKTKRDLARLSQILGERKKAAGGAS